MDAPGNRLALPYVTKLRSRLGMSLYNRSAFPSSPGSLQRRGLSPFHPFLRHHQLDQVGVYSFTSMWRNISSGDSGRENGCLRIERMAVVKRARESSVVIQNFAFRRWRRDASSCAMAVDSALRFGRAHRVPVGLSRYGERCRQPETRTTCKGLPRRQKVSTAPRCAA